MILRIFAVFSFALAFTTGCAPVENSGSNVSFKSYNSIYEDTTGQPTNQGDVGLIGQMGNQQGDGGLGSGTTPNTGDGGLSGGTDSNDGGLNSGNNGGMNFGLGTWSGNNGGTDEPDGGINGGQGGTVDGITNRPADDNVLVGTNVKKMCQAGEIDILRAVLLCQPTQNLILTMLDPAGEVVLENFGSVDSNNGDVEALLSQLKNMNAMGATPGVAINIFLCIDHNDNGSCRDEEVTDLNEYNDVFLQTVQKYAKGIKEDDVAKFCAEDKLGALTNGLVVYHQEFVDQSSEVGKSCMNNKAERQVAKEMAKQIKNITQETDAVDINLGTQFEISLVESDREVCSEVGARLHGCFIAGTEINISKDFKMPIEELRKGDSVMLSNGKKSEVTKVISGPEAKPVVKLQLVTGETLTVTQTHPMLTEMGVVQAKNLSIGSRLLTEKGHWATLTSISTEKYEGHVFNIQLAGDHETGHLIFGNGVVTGDLYLQQKLQDKPTPGIHFTLNY